MAAALPAGGPAAVSALPDLDRAPRSLAGSGSGQGLSIRACSSLRPALLEPWHSSSSTATGGLCPVIRLHREGLPLPLRRPISPAKVPRLHGYSQATFDDLKGVC